MENCQAFGQKTHSILKSIDLIHYIHCNKLEKDIQNPLN